MSQNLSEPTYKKYSRNTVEKQIALFSLYDAKTFIKFLQLLQPDDISNELYAEIYRRQKDYYTKKLCLHDKDYLLDSIKEQRLEEKVDVSEIEVLREKRPAYSSTHDVLENLLHYVHKSRIINALGKCTEEIQKPDFDGSGMMSLMSEAVSVNYDTNTGMSVFEFRRRIDELKRITKDAVPSFSIGLNNKSSGGRFPGELYVYMAPPGVGKSLFLVQDAYHALIKGYKSVYITCELSENRVGLRFDCLHARMTTGEIFKNNQAVEDRYKTLKKVTKGDIKIKEYPPNSATVLELSVYLDQLKLYEDYVPDILFVDYGDILKPMRSRDKDYNEQGEIFTALRKLAVERKIPVVTATQSTRDMLNKVSQKVNMGHVSDSFTIPRIADAMYALAQTEGEREDGIINLKIVKNRNGMVGAHIPFKIDYAKMRAVEENTAKN